MVSRLLADRNFKCPACRYPLRGIAGNTCPECGLVLTRSRLLFSVADWRTAPFFLGLAGLFVSFAPAVFATVVILRGAFYGGVRLDVADRFNIFVIFAWLLTIGRLVVAWVNWGGAMAAWARWRHWTAALACWLLLPLGAGIAFLMRVFP